MPIEPHAVVLEDHAVAVRDGVIVAVLPRAEARAMSLDRLPYNWMPIGGRYPPGPEYNALYEMAKERTDPETGTPPVPEEPEN